MSALRPIGSSVGPSPNVAGLIFVALIITACLTTLMMYANILEQFRARNASVDLLSRLEGRLPQRSGANARPPGSPFLAGQTATIASAALLQRLTTIVTGAGGTIISTEMIQSGAQSKDGFLSAIANCELEHDALQRVLYEIEAGLPFLFVEQLIVQPSSGPGESGKLRVTLGVTAQWAGGK